MQFTKMQSPKDWLILVWSILLGVITAYAVFYPLFPNNLTLQWIMGILASGFIFGAWIFIFQK